MARAPLTLRLNEAVERNSRKFHEDFRFQLTREESTALAANRADPYS